MNCTVTKPLRIASKLKKFEIEFHKDLPSHRITANVFSISSGRDVLTSTTSVMNVSFGETINTSCKKNSVEKSNTLCIARGKVDI